jgi:DNA polymerase/3'-5' exonuclease PolX
MKTRRPLAEMEAVAEQLVAQLEPVCRRIVVAGSIRRRVADPGDIELVCAPRLHTTADLFGMPGQELNLLDDFVTALLDQGVLEHRLDKHGRPSCGSRYKRLCYQGVALDLFAVIEPAQWGVLLAIRTGPATFSKTLVTPRRQGGWCPDWLQCKDGALVRRDSGEIVPTPEEEDCFRALGLTYVPPEQRDRVAV